MVKRLGYEPGSFQQATQRRALALWSITYSKDKGTVYVKKIEKEPRQ
jgi:hypothetical protein